MDNAIDIGYREATVFVRDVSRILADPDLRKDVTPDRMQVLTDFKSAATEMGMEPDGFVRLTLAPGASMADACAK